MTTAITTGRNAKQASNQLAGTTAGSHGSVNASSAENGNAVTGLLWGTLLSIPLWAIVALAVRLLLPIG